MLEDLLESEALPVSSAEYSTNSLSPLEDTRFRWKEEEGGFREFVQFINVRPTDRNNNNISRDERCDDQGCKNQEAKAEENEGEGKDEDVNEQQPNNSSIVILWHLCVCVRRCCNLLHSRAQHSTILHSTSNTIFRVGSFMHFPIYWKSQFLQTFHRKS